MSNNTFITPFSSSRTRAAIKIITGLGRFVSCFGKDSDGKQSIICVSYSGKYGKFYFDINNKTYHKDVLVDLMTGTSQKP